jgi:2-oxoisovalerate dehydrogenase E2 component (dihydrolipoyl transacylase)
MFLQRGSRVLQKQWHVAKGMRNMAMGSRAPMMAVSPRWFSESRRLMAIKPVVLADIGEGRTAIHTSPVLSAF